MKIEISVKINISSFHYFDRNKNSIQWQQSNWYRHGSHLFQVRELFKRYGTRSLLFFFSIKLISFIRFMWKLFKKIKKNEEILHCNVCFEVTLSFVLIFDQEYKISIIKSNSWIFNVQDAWTKDVNHHSNNLKIEVEEFLGQNFLIDPEFFSNSNLP